MSVLVLLQQKSQYGLVFTRNFILSNIAGPPWYVKFANPACLSQNGCRPKESQRVDLKAGCRERGRERAIERWGGMEGWEGTLAMR